MLRGLAAVSSCSVCATLYIGAATRAVRGVRAHSILREKHVWGGLATPHWQHVTVSFVIAPLEARGWEGAAAAAAATAPVSLAPAPAAIPVLSIPSSRRRSLRFLGVTCAPAVSRDVQWVMSGRWWGGGRGYGGCRLPLDASLGRSWRLTSARQPSSCALQALVYWRAGPLSRAHALACWARGWLR